jgi:hypothetical protein
MIPTRIGRFPREIAGYRLPDITRSESDLARVRHTDLPLLSDGELMAEDTAARRAYSECIGNDRAYVHVPELPGFVAACSWLLSRIEAIEAERRERRSRSRR